jgi:murein DD-endopeptidase MepM/ murein hydrolase activator NlpD
MMRVALALAVGVLTLPVEADRSLTVSTEARGVQPGELVLVTVTTSEPAETLTIRAFDRDIPAYAVDALRWRALVGIDLDAELGDHVVAIEAASADGTERTTHTLSVAEKAFRTRTLQVDNAFVNPPASTQARIEREAVELNRIWRESSDTRLWAGAFVRPVPHDANSAFGTRSIFNGQRRSPHGGADFLSPAGTPVASPNAGRIVLADNLYYTGGTVVIDHGLGLVSLFAHLSAFDVEAGDMVNTGDVVGRVGATGRVTGAHLHWTLRLGGTRIDPLSLLAVLGG